MPAPPCRTLTLTLTWTLTLTARADDRPEQGTACQAPVMVSLDPDWRREALRFRETALRSFSRSLGGDEAARQQMRAALQWAQTTRVGAYEVIQITRELLLRGFRGKELEAVRAAALDLRASSSSEGTARFVHALGAALSRGTLSSEDLRELDEVATPAVLQEAVGRRLGVPGPPEAVREQARLRLDRGVDAATGIAAVLEVVAQKAGAAQPGDAARAALHTCVVQMSRTCPRKEAEAHCQSTPREYLDLMRQDL